MSMSDAWCPPPLPDGEKFALKEHLIAPLWLPAAGLLDRAQPLHPLILYRRCRMSKRNFDNEASDFNIPCGEVGAFDA